MEAQEGQASEELEEPSTSALFPQQDCPVPQAHPKDTLPILAE